MGRRTWGGRPDHPTPQGGRRRADSKNSLNRWQAAASRRRFRGEAGSGVPASNRPVCCRDLLRAAIHLTGAAAAGGRRGGRPVSDRRTWGGRSAVPPLAAAGSRREADSLKVVPECSGGIRCRRPLGTASGGINGEHAWECNRQWPASSSALPVRHVTCGRSSYVPTASRR